ncbi:MAG: DNA alkylation repair protein [Bacteroidales bacterium]|nr:DNA alkylation repair protein [Bacteroidales bacterium]
MISNEIIKSIKNEFRLGMNGVISTSMRNKGMDYKIIFGLSLPQLRTIAEKYSFNKEVAEILWKEDIRESKLLATMIYPYEEMNIEVAKLWINDIRFTEVADISTMFLFSKFSYADKLVIDNINSEDDNKKYFAMRLFIRLVINKTEINSNIIAMVKEAANRYINSDNIAVATIANDIILRLEN